MQTNELIDLDHLEKYVAGDFVLRDELLDIFVQQVEFLLSKFEATQSDEEWIDNSHALKGTSRGVGAWALGRLSEQAEDMVGSAEDLHDIREAHLVLLRYMARSVIIQSQAYKVAS